VKFLLALLLSCLSLPALAYQEETVCLGVEEAALTDDERYLAWTSKGTWEIYSITFAPATAVAVNATNVNAFTVAINAGVASTTWTTLASHTTDSDLTSSPYVVGTVIDLTVTKPSTLSRGYQIRAENTNGGTGQVWDGTICVTARKVG
jgi:hypothetical protein